MSEIKFKRILLKLSGESLMGNKGSGIDPDVLTFYAKEIKKVHDLKIEIGIVIGGGNIYRGLNASEQGIDRSNIKGHADRFWSIALALFAAKNTTSNDVIIHSAKTNLTTKLLNKY